MGNEIVLVDQFVEEAQKSRDIRLDDDVAFEHFAASIALDFYNLSDEEIESGRIGGAQDGGIDGVYIFLDDQLLGEDSATVRDDFDPQKVRRGAELTMWLIQAKRSSGFGEDVFNRVRASTEKLLDLKLSNEKLASLYSPALVTRFELFTQAWKNIGIRSPRITINFCYVSRGDASEVSTGVLQKQADLKKHIGSLVPGSVIDVSMLGARELWERASATPEYDLQLRFRDYVSEGESYTGLVSLPDYFRFLSDDTGNLRAHLFDWNVRDFQGSVAVNKQIQASLETDNDRDFWWLNNGVTILCNKATIGGDKTFALSGVQIVNGMQTSHTIHGVLTKTGAEQRLHERRSVQVRIIKTQDAETRDQIIRATNSQTKVDDASLHATEDIHRQLEAHFHSHGWFYDRRKNFYKNQGKPADKIISIAMLGQAMMAVGLSRPDDARARPTSLLNKDDDYDAIFNPKLPLSTYLWIAATQRRIDSLISQDPRASEASVRTNTRFFVSCYLVTREFGARVYHPGQLSDVIKSEFSVEASAVSFALTVVLRELELLVEKNDWQPERVSKSRPLTEAVISHAIAATR